MSFKISNTVNRTPYSMLLFGEAGTGKTFLASYAEKPFFIALEKGSELLKDVGRFVDDENNQIMPKDYTQFVEMCTFLAKEDHGYKTIVIDSAMFLDDLMKKDVILKNPTVHRKDGEIKVKNIDEYDFMFGYSEVIKRWQTVIAFKDALNKKGINLIIIAHAAKVKHTELDGTEYKRIEPDMIAALGGKYSTGDLLRAAVDFVFYIESVAQVDKEKGFRGKMVNVPVNGTLERFNKPIVTLYTRQTNRFVAKCRATDYNNIQSEYRIDFDDINTQKQVFLDILK